MRTLYIAEKPSVARDIARVLGATEKKGGYIEGAGCIVTWCFGHLAGIAPKPEHYNPEWKTWNLNDLPILPSDLEIVATGDKGARKQLAVITKLLRASDIGVIVNACDAAREGEAIFRNVYEYAQSAKPIKRLWIASMTDEAIRDGLAHLRPGTDYQSLADAARSREEADWLIGINATRALTLKARELGAQSLYSLGRVQTPTLALIVGRDVSIDAFVPTPYWELAATFRAPRPQSNAPQSFDAIYTPGDGARLINIDQAKALQQMLSKVSAGRISTLEEREKRLKPPLLFDLTSLQRAANTSLGFSAKKTLDLAQALYEKHKVLTYPRTDSAYITQDLKTTLLDRVVACQAGSWATLCDHVQEHTPTFQKRVVNDAKVTDHHAILPTETSVSLEQLSTDEAAIYEMVARRMLASYFADVQQAHTTCVVELEGYPFLAKGTRLIDSGWWRAEPPKKKPSVVLPSLDPAEDVPLVELRLGEKATRPPKRFTEAALLGAMETAGKELDDEELRQSMKERGIGTPATRASIIELLLKRKYLAREGKALVSTPLGRELIAALPDPTLKSAELTGQWEYALEMVRKGDISRSEFMKKVRELASGLTSNIKSAKIEISAPEVVVLGACPFCGTSVHETPKVYTCASGRQCKFVIFKSIAKKKISPTIVKTLLKDRRTKPIKGFTSKAGKKFSAALELQDTGKISFVFEKKAGA